jgi:hypothetical protein
MKESIKRLLQLFIQNEKVDQCFKFLSVASILLFRNNHQIVAVLLFLIVVIFLSQLFFYGLINIVIPICEAFFPNTKYIETFKLLLTLPKETRYRIAKELMLAWQFIVFFMLYLAFFYLMTFLFNTLLSLYLLKL